MEYTFEERADCIREYGDAQDLFDAWFSVSGDTDDFIFFGESDRAHSEK